MTSDVPPNFSQTFNFVATCPGAPGSPFALAITYPAATFVTQANIPTGSVCTVTEGTRTDVPGYEWGTPTIGAPVTITAKDTAYTVAVSNPTSRNTGSSQTISDVHISTSWGCLDMNQQTMGVTPLGCNPFTTDSIIKVHFCQWA